MESDPVTLGSVLHQAGLALGWYVALIGIMRAAGKRLAGQVTTFDLLVLITLGVVLQNSTLKEGTTHAIVFVIVAFAAHRLLAYACAKSRRLRRIVRGAPRPLVVDGRVAYDALEDEGMSYDELLAGLRKLGYDGPHRVRLATLEETGHVSAIAFEPTPAAVSSTPSARSA